MKFNDNIYLNLSNEIIKEDRFISDFEDVYKLGILCDLFFISNENANTITSDIEKEIFTIIEEKGDEISLIFKKLLEASFVFANLDTIDLIDTDKEDNIEYENSINYIDDIKNLSYRIGISIFYYGKYIKERKKEKNITIINNVILYRLFSRLGILGTSRDETLDATTDIFSIDIIGKLEMAKKEVSNLFVLGGESIYLSDFQTDIMKSLLDNQSVAISAPTSAGKTFVVKKFIIKKLIEAKDRNHNINIIFIVPTKALINEQLFSIVSDLKRFGLEQNVNLLSYINGETYEKEEIYNKKSNIFILTQERLHHFFYGLSSDFKLHLLVIDEAHKVGHGNRGLLLKSIIDDVLERSSMAFNVILLSPLVKQIKDFENIFNFKQIKLEEKFSRFNLVSNNIIVSDKKGEFLYKSPLQNDLKSLVKSRFTKGISSIDRLINMYKLFNVREKSILYYRSPGNMSKISQRLLDINTMSGNKDLIVFLEDILGKNTLTKSIAGGYAFHNGQIPPNIRFYIENEFKNKDGLIKDIIANKTILEGVNLPAKSIFLVFVGQDKNMKISDFNNLIGRAGRLGEHFTGNIFIDVKDFNLDLIKVEDKTILEEPEDDILEGNESEKVSKYDLFKSYIMTTKYPEIELSDTTRYSFEYLYNFLYSKYKRLSGSEFKKYISSKKKLKHIEGLLIQSYVNLDNEISEISILNYTIVNILLNKNIFIDIRKQLRLINDYIKGRIAIKNISILSSPKQHKKFEEELVGIFGYITDYLLYGFGCQKMRKIMSDKGKKGVVQDINYLKKWVTEQSYKTMLSYASKQTIFTLYEKINNRIQFTYLNSITSFITIINIVKLSLKEDKIKDNIITFIELGISSNVGIYLITLGMSRESTVFVLDYLEDKNFKGFDRWMEIDNIKIFFIQNKEFILQLFKDKKIIKEELKEFIY